MAGNEEVHAKGGKGGKNGLKLPPQNPMNLWMINADDCPDGRWPTIQPCHAIPKRLVTFMVADSERHGDAFCHFFIDDYRFERLWNDPRGYLPILRRYAGVIGPDFSTYTDMPKPMQQWNAYRCRALEAYWQRQGITVIPNVQFGQRDTWEWAFDGMPRRSVLCTSCVGLYKDREGRSNFVRGMEECVGALEPTALVMYGHEIPFDAGGIPVLWYANDNDKRMTDRRNRVRSGPR